MASTQESLSLPHIIRNRELSDGESPLSDDEDSEENETLRVTRKDPREFSPKPLGDEVQDDAHTLRPTDEFEYIPFPSLQSKPTPPTQDRKRIYTSPRSSKIEKNSRPIPPPKPKYLKESRLLKSPTADCRPLSRDSGISICTNPHCPYSTGQHILRISILPDSKDEIYEVHSPAQTGDSGIEHTRATPSTSTDFSPRSDLKSEYASPRPPSKTLESVNQLLIHRRETPPPDHTPPPPPSTLSTEERLYSEEQRQKARDTLDQVLIPIAVERERSRGTIDSNQGIEDELSEEENIPIDHQHLIEEETFPEPPPHILKQESKESVVTQNAKFSCLSEREESARVEATLHLAPTKISQAISRTFPSRQAISFERPNEKSVLVELTVELNREQNALISTHKYPQKVQGERAIISTKVQNGVRKTTSQSNMVPPAPLYRAVDIPFDDSTTAAYQPPTRNEKSSKDDHFTVILEMGSQPVHKGFGMGVHSERGEPLKVESVLVGTPADRAGLQVGDRITSINGEDVVDAYPSAINRMLHEAARLGEVELRILRVATTHYENVSRLQKSASAASFDKTRSIFQGASLAKTPEQRKREAFGSMSSGTLRQDSAVSRNSQSSISSTTSEHRGLQRSSNGSSFDPYRAPEIKMTQTSTAPQIDSGFRKSYGVEGDFRVTTASVKHGPGRLSDFVPEVERDSHIREALYQDDESRKCEDDSIPKTIRNYDLRPTPAINQSFALRRESDHASVCAVLKRSTLPRNAGGKSLEDASETDGDFNDEKDSLAEGAVRVSVEPRSRRASGSAMVAPRSAPLRSSSQDSLLTTTEEIYRRYEYRRYTPTYADPRDYDHLVDHLPRTRVIPVIRDPRPPSREEIYYPRIETVPVYRSTPVPEEAPTIASGRITPIPIERRYRNESPEIRRDDNGSVRSRARSTDARGSTSRPIYIQRKQYNNYYDPDYDEIDNDGVSRASHRFYDKDGRALRREERREERVVEVTRSYENLEEDPREWRQVIKSQRQAAPGQPRDTQRIRDASQSLGNLPTYINRRMKEQEEKEREERKYLDSARKDVQEDFRQRNIEKNRERQDLRNYRESNLDDRQPRVVNDWREQERTYNGGPAPDGYSSLHRSYGNERPNDQGHVDPRYGTIPDKPQRHPAQPYQRDFDKQEPVVAVSGKHRCGHCGNELGRGQAMIIESLSLYYHLSCFRCIVCGTTLGNGTTGADVRVRDGKLHCYSCYSNDAVQLSKV